MKRFLYFLLFLIVSLPVFSQSCTYEIMNTRGEHRFMLASQEIAEVIQAACGFKTFKKSHFKLSADNKVNLDSLDITAIQFRKLFPKNYWGKDVSTVMLDTNPNDDSQIWIENVFTETDSKHNIKAAAAIRVKFAGTDTEQFRLHPTVQDIIIITDPLILKKYSSVIKRLKKINNIQSSAKQDRRDIPPPPPFPPSVKS